MCPCLCLTACEDAERPSGSVEPSPWPHTVAAIQPLVGIDGRSCSGDARGIYCKRYGCEKWAMWRHLTLCEGLPVGITLLGRRYQEPELIQWAYAFEQKHKIRVPPPTVPPL